jgi:hypothetical protein
MSALKIGLRGLESRPATSRTEPFTAKVAEKRR